MRFTIGIYKRDINPYAACFSDLAESLACALRALGHEVVGFQDPGRLIMFGVNNAHDVAGEMPADAIVFNTEQISSLDDPAGQMSAHEQYKNRVVWDYSRVNIELLRGLGLRRLVHCPIGYVPEMERIKPVEEDVDVLFYGALNERRRDLLIKLEDAGLSVHVVKGIFGRDLDEFIARAKVVLNVHFYERPIFEVVRCSHLWANKKCVVTEGGGIDEELEDLARRCAYRVSYDGLVDACKLLVSNELVRSARKERGYELFKKINFVNSVREALEGS